MNRPTTPAGAPRPAVPGMPGSAVGPMVGAATAGKCTPRAKGSYKHYDAIHAYVSMAHHVHPLVTPATT